MVINEYIVEKIIDPTGILTGDRYEFRLYITVDEEDELYAEEGIGIRAIFTIDEGQERIVSSHFFNRSTEKALDFELEEEEEAAILEFCKLHYNE
jgi:hypothetical protein